MGDAVIELRVEGPGAERAAKDLSDLISAHFGPGPHRVPGHLSALEAATADGPVAAVVSLALPGAALASGDFEERVHLAWKLELLINRARITRDRFPDVNVYLALTGGKTLRLDLAASADILMGVSDVEAVECICASLVAKARILAAKGFLKDAARVLHQVVAMAKAGRSLRVASVVLGEAAGVSVEMGLFEEAQSLLEERLRICDDLGDLQGRADAFLSLGRMEMRRRCYHRAFEHLSLSHALNLKLGGLENLCRVGMDLGAVMCLLGQREAGIGRLMDSMEGFRRLGRDDLARAVEGIIREFT